MAYKPFAFFPVSVLVSLFLSIACSDRSVPHADKPSEKTGSISGQPALTAVADHLRTPWAIDFDGETIYISEREGDIVRIKGNTTDRQAVALSKKVLAKGEGGFLGFVLGPDFAKSKKAYAYHTYQEDGKTYNRVVMLLEDPDGWKETGALIEKIPGSSNHNGGRLAFGPDGNLYITTGDSETGDLAQDVGSTAGKILRMTPDGKVPADNPFPGSFVYSYGHRNSQGIAWDSRGRMYASEHGPSGNPGAHDEINAIEPGRNYGWPIIYGDQKKTGLVTALYQTGEMTLAPSGIAFDSADRLLVATLRGTKLLRFNPDTKAMETMLENEGRLRDVKLHNGAVYVITNNTDGRGNPSITDDRLLIVR